MSRVDRIKHPAMTGRCIEELEAVERLAAVLSVRALRRDAFAPAYARKIAARQARVSVRSINRWLDRIVGVQEQDWLAALTKGGRS